jgi:hypothetical protein
MLLPASSPSFPKGCNVNMNKPTHNNGIPSSTEKACRC